MKLPTVLSSVLLATTALALAVPGPNRNVTVSGHDHEVTVAGLDVSGLEDEVWDGKISLCDACAIWFLSCSRGVPKKGDYQCACLTSARFNGQCRSSCFFRIC
ncbi:hypothetical protein BDW02DRAFT_632003 [Decorospora gaudefroyi]|uniref:Invertebrate defensins family profile domain-containing protein n=1 Tax=Decorospora gaudefroyi TaxID=184978 RepID=A0A6A5K339_9PLEO|nr:hypothetical protein BDW02DRAFT_649736 [Decorospora gaudefroyi]KAF1832518.1 hypothetical protein BDW02DRAFT_632003 [Decorospora gaudefroyi]